jgi:hypothetical protein
VYENNKATLDDHEGGILQHDWTVFWTLSVVWVYFMTTFENLVCFRLRYETGQRKPIEMDPFEMSSLRHWTQFSVLKVNTDQVLEALLYNKRNTMGKVQDIRGT